MNPEEENKKDEGGYTPDEQEALACLKDSFIESLEPASAMLLVFEATQNLAPGTPAGDAAIDRLIDLAHKNMQHPLAVTFLRMAAAKAVPGSDLSEKGLSLLYDHMQQIKNPEKRAAQANYIMWDMPDPPPAYKGKFTRIWTDVMNDYMKSDPAGPVLRMVDDVATSPLTKGELRDAANALWPWVIDRIADESGYITAIVAAQSTSRKIYETSEGPHDFADIKESVATKILDLSIQVSSEELLYAAIMDAAAYDGDNAGLHARIAGRLAQVAQSSPNPEYRQAAAEKLRGHAPPSRGFLPPSPE